MRALAAAALLLAGCGDPHPSPRVASAPPPAADAAPAPHHAPPACPLAPALASLPARDPSPEARRAQAERGDRCGVADDNLSRVEAAILAPRTPGPAVRSAPWDHKRAPEHARHVTERLALDAGEQAHLARDGFVVLPRLRFGSYAAAFHELYQSQLPLYVSVDAVLHAVYAGNDSLLADLEDARVAPLLGRTLDRLACAVAAAPMPAEQRADLDVYLAVARALLRGEPPQSMTGDPAIEAQAAALVAAATAAQEMSTVQLFGRARVIDFTSYAPRGHYAAAPERQRFFRAAMWLSRLEWNLVSRDSRSSQPGATPDPRETPREELDALALATVAMAAAPDDIALLDQAWTLLAGPREDISLPELARLGAAAHVAPDLSEPDAPARLRAAIGAGYRRTTRMHYMPQGARELPVIATLLGPRVVPDAAATRPLVDDELPGRRVLHAADLAYVLGHDRARAYLADDRARFPALDAQLGKARAAFAAAPRGQGDLYSAWLAAIAGLAEVPAGARPTFMATAAYADLRIDSALAAFGQLKHNFVLVAGEAYSAGGCEIPDGYVEPAPATYAALRAYATRGATVAHALDPADTLGAAAYFDRLGTVLRVLDAIAADELAGRALTADERAFLSMVAEMAPATTGSPPTYTGWWFDLFRAREADGLAGADFLASVFTGDTIAYVGATAPRLGVFVIDTGGAPRLAVGPVARAYEHQDEVAHRLDDTAGAALPEAARSDPWADSYTAAPGAPEPALQLIYPAQDTRHRLDAAIDAKTDLGPVTIELYDHHRVPLARVTRSVHPGTTYFPLPGGKVAERGEGVHLQVGRFHGWYDAGLVEGAVYATLGGYGGE